jgi:alpha-beta hydrolase superfamily lysophospholipase
LTASGGAVISHRGWAQYGTLSVPVLALHGTADQSTDPTGSSDFISAIASPDKALMLLDDAKHALLDDLGAVATRDAVIDWIAARMEA